MIKVKLSQRAIEDLAAIHAYGIRQFGLNQAERYFDELVGMFQVLEDHPLAGQAVDQIQGNLRNLHVRSHVIYYRIDDPDIRILSILHQRMMPELHLR